MTCEEFVIWLRGFTKASNNYNITPKQWDDLRDQLELVNGYSDIKNLIIKYPNDTELGREIRKIYK